MACLGVFSLFLMTAATGCSDSSMRNGGDNQTQAGFAKCGANCTKACCKKADAKSTQTQGGFDKCGANCAKACCKKSQGKTTQTQGGFAKCSGSGFKGKSGCTGKAKTVSGATTASLNKTCPISGRTVSTGVTASYGDKTVGFCCGGCISKWNALTDADKTSKLTGA